MTPRRDRFNRGSRNDLQFVHFGRGIPPATVSACPPGIHTESTIRTTQRCQMALGPIEILVIEFPGNQFTGDIIPELERLIENDTISIIDGLLVKKDDDGEVTFVEFDELGINDDAAKLAGVVDQLDALISDEDVEEWAADLAAGQLRSDPRVRAHLGQGFPRRRRQLRWRAGDDFRIPGGRRRTARRTGRDQRRLTSSEPTASTTNNRHVGPTNKENRTCHDDVWDAQVWLARWPARRSSPERRPRSPGHRRSKQAAATRPRPNRLRSCSSRWPRCRRRWTRCRRSRRRSMPVAEQLAAAQAAPPPHRPRLPLLPAPDLMADLQKLADLKAQGLLTDEEFASMKAKLLA